MSNIKVISDQDLKAKFLAEAQSTTPPSPTNSFPTEIIDLPSKGIPYSADHPLSSGKIEMKYMTAREEDILSSQSLIKQGVVIDKLLQALIVTKVDYDSILACDRAAIFLAARGLAYGKNYNVEIGCPDCGVKSKHVIDLSSFSEREVDWSQFKKGENKYTFKLPSSGKELTLKLLTHGDEKEIDEELKSLKKVAAVSPEMTTRLKHVIIAVDQDTSRATINSTVDSLLSSDSLALRNHIKAVTPDIDTTFTFTCPSCGYEQDRMNLPITLEFFWPGA